MAESYENQFNQIMADQDAEFKAREEAWDKATEKLKTLGISPYSFSDLTLYLSLESWDWQDALVLLVGADPRKSTINWEGYIDSRFMFIKSPEVEDAAFLDCRFSEYDVPTSYTYQRNEDYFKGDKAIARKISELGQLQTKLEKLYLFWVHSLPPQQPKNPPIYYIEWAISKKHQIQWLGYAAENGFYKSAPTPEIEKPLKDTERNTLLILIAALAEEAKLNISKTSKTGELIASLTQQMGAPVSATTIERHLKKIPEALKSRAK